MLGNPLKFLCVFLLAWISLHCSKFKVYFVVFVCQFSVCVCVCVYCMCVSPRGTILFPHTPAELLSFPQIWARTPDWDNESMCVCCVHMVVSSQCVHVANPGDTHPMGSLTHTCLRAPKRAKKEGERWGEWVEKELFSPWNSVCEWGWTHTHI